jgi:hypothetical protein
MKVIDALLMKLAEETAELSGAASGAGQMCSKAVRFGMDSHHPDDVHHTPNEQLLAGAIANAVREFMDVQIFYWLVCYYRQIYLKVVPLLPAERLQHQDLAKRIFRDEKGLSNAITKLDQYARLTPAMVENRAITSAEHLELVTCIADARAFIMDIKEEPFEL